MQEEAKKKLLGVATKTHVIRDETAPDAQYVGQQQQADKAWLRPSTPNCSEVQSGVSLFTCCLETSFYADEVPVFAAACLVLLQLPSQPDVGSVVRVAVGRLAQ